MQTISLAKKVGLRNVVPYTPYSPPVHVCPIPQEISTELASATMFNALTVNMLVSTIYPVKKGSTVLVHVCSHQFHSQSMEGLTEIGRGRRCRSSIVPGVSPPGRESYRDMFER